VILRRSSPLLLWAKSGNAVSINAQKNRFNKGRPQRCLRGIFQGEDA
jgi:hypothetical protein